MIFYHSFINSFLDLTKIHIHTTWRKVVSHFVYALYCFYNYSQYQVSHVIIHPSDTRTIHVKGI